MTLNNLLLNLKQLLSYTFFLLILSACENLEEGVKIPYQVDPEFEPYVQRFVLEAAKRGRNIDLSEEGMIIEFVDNLALFRRDELQWIEVIGTEPMKRLELDGFSMNSAIVT